MTEKLCGILQFWIKTKRTKHIKCDHLFIENIFIHSFHWNSLFILVIVLDIYLYKWSGTYFIHLYIYIRERKRKRRKKKEKTFYIKTGWDFQKLFHFCSNNNLSYFYFWIRYKKKKYRIWLKIENVQNNLIISYNEMWVSNTFKIHSKRHILSILFSKSIVLYPWI